MANDGAYQGFKLEVLQETIKDAETYVVDKLKDVKNKASEEINVGDMFDMQWMMNKFSQISEMTSAVLAACHGAISSMTRNIK